MLFIFKNIRFRLKLIKISERNISKWKETMQVKKLEYALKYGNYATRELAAIALGEIGNKTSIPLLLIAIDDTVKNVSIAALNALENIGNVDKLNSLIIRKRFNWLKVRREKNANFEANKNKKQKIYKWERTSKRSFDIVKEQLKRPMR